MERVPVKLIKLLASNVGEEHDVHLRRVVDLPPHVIGALGGAGMAEVGEPTWSDFVQEVYVDLATGDVAIHLEDGKLDEGAGAETVERWQARGFERYGADPPPPPPAPAEEYGRGPDGSLHHVPSLLARLASATELASPVARGNER